MSNSTYCEDHYEQPDWMKKIQGLEKQNKELRELLEKNEKEYIDKEKIRKEVKRLQKRAEHNFDISLTENERQFWLGEFNVLTLIGKYIDSLQEEHKLKPKFQEGNKIVYSGERKELDTDEHTILYVYNDMYVTTWGEKIPFKFQDDYQLVEKTVSVWHNASEEPNDMSHCLIFYGCKESVGHYLHYEPVLYNKKEKTFVTSSFPHPTGYKVEQKSFDGGCVAEVYKNKRDRISISDIAQWCYLCDLHNLSNVQRIGKEWKEEPVSEELEDAAVKWFNSVKYKSDLTGTPINAFKAGAEWKEEEMMAKAINTEASLTMSVPSICISLPLGVNVGDKVKVIVIKEK